MGSTGELLFQEKWVAHRARSVSLMLYGPKNAAHSGEGRKSIFQHALTDHKSTVMRSKPCFDTTGTTLVCVLDKRRKEPTPE